MNGIPSSGAPRLSSYERSLLPVQERPAPLSPWERVDLLLDKVDELQTEKIRLLTDNAALRVRLRDLTTGPPEPQALVW